jgi:hypothetical protein
VVKLDSAWASQTVAVPINTTSTDGAEVLQQIKAAMREDVEVASLQVNAS